MSKFRILFRMMPLISLGLLMACNGPRRKEQSPARASFKVKSALAQTQPFEELYRASGSVRGHNTAVLTSKTTGYVRSVLVRPGDTVKNGQLLATLEANDVEASVRVVRAALDQAVETRSEAESAVKAAESAARIAKSTRDRVATLYAKDSVSKQSLDEAEEHWRGAVAAQEMAHARLRTTLSRIEQAKAEVSGAQATLDYAHIVSPFAGRIIERRVDAGNLATPGMALLVVESEGTLRAEVSVEESHASAVAVGESAQVEIEGVDGVVTGKVVEIVPAIDVASRAFLVKVDLPETLKGLRPGMFARVGFSIGATKKLAVPKSATTSFGALDRVFVIEGHQARIRMVTLGESQGPWVEILTGLSEGDRVIDSPPANLMDGAAVEGSS